MAGRYPSLRACSVAAMMMLVVAIMLQPTVAVAEMTDEEVAAAREEALAKLEKPLEKTPVKELLAMLKERGVECKDCKGAEKGVIVAQVKAAIHLPKVQTAGDGKKAEDKKKKTGDEMKPEDVDDVEPPAAEMTDEEVTAAREEALAKLEKPLEKTSVKELLAMLKERGVECKDCKGAEKGHIVAQVKAAIHLSKKKVQKKKKEKKEKEEDIEDLMAKLKGMPGMENIKMFGREDMEKMAKGGKFDL